MATSDKKLRMGTKVGFTPVSGNADTGRVFVIESSQVINGVLFYMLKGMPSSLFIRSSLYI